MIQAYRNNDIEAAVKCMDFPAIAGARLKRKYPPATPAAIAGEASRFEQEWREIFRKYGLPDYSEIRIESINKPTVRDTGFRVDCNVIGPKASTRLVLFMTKTQVGWRFIHPPDRFALLDDFAPFPYDFN